MNEEDPSKIDALNKSLYSRTAPDIRTKRRLRFHEQTSDIRTDWDHPVEDSEESVELNKKYKDSSMSFFTKFLITSVIFFIVALGIGAFLIYNGSNIVSPDNVDITINGPISIAGGEPVSFDVQVNNHNNIKLQTVDVSVDFPTGTTDAGDSLKELKNSRELIPDINPGGMGQKTIQAVLYGEENSKKEIKVTVEYRVQGSDAVSVKEKTFEVLISSSPLALSVFSFKEVNSGQEFDIAVVVNSNSKEVIKNLLLKAAYPFGFSFISSDIKPVSDGVWKIGDIPPGGKKTIKIHGRLDGQDDEVRVFRFMIGAARLGNDKDIGTEYIASTQEVSIKKPFMSVNIAANGDTTGQGGVAEFNNPVRFDISYFNNLQTAITNAEIHVKLSGSAFSKDSVTTSDGLYQSADNEIVWNGITTDGLKNVDAGGNGHVSFTITPRNLSNSTKNITNPNLKLDVSIKGRRISEDNVPENIVSTAQREMRVSTNVALSGQVIRSSGPFQNIGPIPPQSEQTTTYTIVWTVDNTSNSASNVVVQSALPAYVRWLAKVNAAGEDISYNQSTGAITWNVGGLSTYTAGTTRRRQVAFQIAFNPNVNNVGESPVLVGNTTLTAQDDFTGEVLKSTLGTLNTRFSTDPAFKDGDEKVIR